MAADSKKVSKFPISCIYIYAKNLVLCLKAFHSKQVLSRTPGEKLILR